MKPTIMMAAIAATACLGASAWAQNGNRPGGHPNALTSQEQQEGWVLLFDGKTLDRWNVTPALAKVWKAVDGAIKADLSDAGGTMLTRDAFDNFALKLEFRAHPATSCRSATGIPAITAAATFSLAAS